jgi:hypothetical protein
MVLTTTSVCCCQRQASHSCSVSPYSH